MKATETQVILEVDDDRAEYPVTIDPVFTQEVRLSTSNDNLPGADHFGSSVAIFSNTVVVGVPDDDNGRGSAYVFVRNGAKWNQQARLMGRSPLPNDHFGRFVAISGDMIVVGAPNDDHFFDNQGSAYVFVRIMGRGACCNSCSQTMAP